MKGDNKKEVNANGLGTFIRRIIVLFITVFIISLLITLHKFQIF